MSYLLNFSWEHASRPTYPLRAHIYMHSHGLTTSKMLLTPHLRIVISVMVHLSSGVLEKSLFTSYTKLTSHSDIRRGFLAYVVSHTLYSYMTVQI